MPLSRHEPRLTATLLRRCLPPQWYDRAIESFLKQLGADAWRGTLHSAVGQDPVLWCTPSCPAGDTATLALFCSAAQSNTLEATPHQLLEEFGEYFVSYLTEQVGAKYRAL